MSESTGYWWRPTWWVLLIIALVLLVVLVCAAYYRTIRRVREAYAAGQAGSMLIEYMRTNDGVWPTSWEDLRPAYDAVAKRGEDACTFDEVRNYVQIDFEVEVSAILEDLSRHDRAHFEAIRLRDGKVTHWIGEEPNSRVLQYLRSVLSSGNCDRGQTDVSSTTRLPGFGY